MKTANYLLHEVNQLVSKAYLQLLMMGMKLVIKLNGSVRISQLEHKNCCIKRQKFG